MWALRRASNPHRGRAFIIRTFQNSYLNSQVASSNLIDKDNKGDSHLGILHRCTCLKSPHCAVHGHTKFSIGWCSFSSQADSKSTREEDDLEDGFSELETQPIMDIDTSSESENEAVPASEPSEEEDDVTEEPQDELLLSDPEEIVTGKKAPKKRVSLALFNALIEAPGRSIQSALDKWIEEGKELNQSEVTMAMINLRRRNMYGRALQLSEWLDSSKHMEFKERDYASRVDLIAKVQGLQKAESYIDKIPEEFKTEIIYRTFLANCVSSTNIKKSESIFNKMKNLGFPLSSFTCNQLLLLYKKIDKKKIADVLLLMEKENIKPTLFTYRILIDTKGQSKDIAGMEQILETMKAEGIEPDLSVQTILARHYVNAGLKDKAESVLREMEGDDITEKKWACPSLLPLYAALGKGDDVARVWEACEGSPRLDDCLAAIEAWGKLGEVEKAEEAFERMTKIAKKPSSKHYSALLRVYANHKMVEKGKDLVKRMSESGVIVGPLTWDALVKLYVQAGEVDKADSLLNKAIQQRQMKPMFSSYMAIMDQYAQKGDIHNSEKMFFKLRQAGYIGRLRQFETLIQAYINAKVPAYGIRERMKADNIFPNKVVAGMLMKVDAFRKTPVSDLLD